MLSIYWSSLLISFGSMQGLNASTQGLKFEAPRLADIQPERVFMPTGFDDNDLNVQVFTSGHLSTSCLKSAAAEAKIVSKDLVKKEIVIRNQVYITPGPICLQIVSTYNYTYSLGMLPEGDYTIKLHQSDSEDRPVLGTVHVAAHKERSPDQQGNLESPDTYDYAEVEAVGLSLVDQSGLTPENQFLTVKVSLLMRRLSTCHVLDKVEVIQSPGNLVEILPKLKDHKGDGSDCKPLDTRFPVQEILVSGLTEDFALFHVRSFNGEAKNVLEDLRNLD